MTIFQMYIQMQLCLGTQMTLDELSPATVSMAGWLALAQSVLVCRKRLTGLQMRAAPCAWAGLSPTVQLPTVQVFVKLLVQRTPGYRILTQTLQDLGPGGPIASHAWPPPG